MVESHIDNQHWSASFYNCCLRFRSHFAFLHCRHRTNQSFQYQKSLCVDRGHVAYARQLDLCFSVVPDSPLDFESHLWSLGLGNYRDGLEVLNPDKKGRILEWQILLQSYNSTATELPIFWVAVVPHSHSYWFHSHGCRPGCAGLEFDRCHQSQLLRYSHWDWL